MGPEVGRVVAHRSGRTSLELVDSDDLETVQDKFQRRRYEPGAEPDDAAGRSTSRPLEGQTAVDLVAVDEVPDTGWKEVFQDPRRDREDRLTD